MADGLTRAQRRLITDVMNGIEGNGFAIAGDVALLEAGLGVRRTSGLEACSPTCLDIEPVVEQLVTELEAADYRVSVHGSERAFACLTVSSGEFRRISLRVELRREPQVFATADGRLGPMLSDRELAANVMLAAFDRHEPRDLVDLEALSHSVSLDQAMVDCCGHDSTFDRDVLAAMVRQTMTVHDDLWPAGSSPSEIREWVATALRSSDEF